MDLQEIASRGTEQEERERSPRARNRKTLRKPKPTREQEQQSAEQSEATIRVEEEYRDIPKRDKPVAQQSEPSEADRKISAAEADAIVPMLLMACNSMAISVGGLEAKIQPQEQMLIEQGMKRTLRRATPKQIERFGFIMDPLMIGFGFFLWGKRITRLQALKEQQHATETAAESSGIAGAAPQIRPESLIPNANGKTEVQDQQVNAAPPPDAITGRWNNNV